MNMVIPNEGKILWLDRALCTPTNAPEDYTLKLFKSNTTIVDASTLADFTIADFAGYADISITRASLPTPTITSNQAKTQRATAPVFTCTAGPSQTVYGWLLVGATSGKIIAGQNFATPRVMDTGSTETLNPFVFAFESLP